VNRQSTTTPAEAHQRLRTILETAFDAFVELDGQGRIADWNARAEQIFGWTRAEAIGQHSEILIPARHRNTYRRISGQLFASARASAGVGPGKPVRITALHRDGRTVPVELRISTVLRDGGWALLAFAHDLTERTRLKNALRERKLHEQELARAKVAAEAANLAKSEFLANMSHEIRTPMNGVIGMTGVLLDTELTAEQREYAEMVRRSGEALLTVINDILDFSKIEAGRMEIESFALDLRLVLEEVGEMLGPKAAEKGIDLVIEYPSGLPRHFLGDAGRIRQVLTNLVGNAVKFTDAGHVLAAVQCEGEDERQSVMRISVTDTGIGIPPDKIGSLFEKFSQADASATRKYGGTGLGLAISKQLVQLMGGSIQVESRVGRGSTFSFKLPLLREAEPGPAPVPITDLTGLRVLVVDDNEINRRVVHEQVSSWGMRYGSFASGDQALAALRAARASGDPYQFVVADYQMPGIDGATLAGEIKADPELKDTVFVML